ncbi:MAG: PQQ-binding-like beta-propeller repeat protein [Thermoguttaceae bacterium]|jgi:outer membrane protein assembly factor BamB
MKRIAKATVKVFEFPVDIEYLSHEPGEHEHPLLIAMNTWTKRVTLGSLIVLTLALSVPAAEPPKDTPAGEAWKIGWPSMIGPTGNMLPLCTPTPLVEDLSQARLAWVSEDNDLGHGKYTSKVFTGHDAVEEKIGPDTKVHPGNWAGVVVTDGRVYGASYRNAGPVFTAPYSSRTGYQKGNPPEVPTRFRVEAEDLVICFDAANGKVLWKAVEPGGQIYSGSKRSGFQVAPAVDEGRVFAVGSTGKIFAYDAVSGKKLWQGDVGDAHKEREAYRVESLKLAAAGKIVIPKMGDWGTSVVVADGVVVTGDFKGGLRGYDAATGDFKWTVSNCLDYRTSTPNVWRHKGKAWILCVSTSLFLIDPQNGKVAWKVDGLGPNPGTLAPGERSVMVNVNKPDKTVRHGLGIWGCYRISPEKAEKAWAMADTVLNSFNITGDARTSFSTRIRDGRVLVWTEGRQNEGAAGFGKVDPGRIVLLDEETGAELLSVQNAHWSSVRGFSGNVLWLGDRAIVRTVNGHHRSCIFIDWIVTPKAIAPRFGDEKKGIDLIEFMGSYDIVASTPLVDGRMFERMEDGRLACYDLRQTSNQPTKSSKE